MALKAAYIQMLVHAFRGPFALELQRKWPVPSREILGRAREVGERVITYKKAYRLIPILKKVIEAEEARGRLHVPGLVLLAEKLQGARGRFQRTWHSPEGGLYMAISVLPYLERRLWHLYGILFAVALCREARSWGIKAWIRWVSDLMIDGKKAGGVLLETMGPTRLGQEYLIVGMGVNVNIKGFPADLTQTATSMASHTGLPIPLATFSARLIARISTLTGLLHAWNARGGADDSPSFENPVVIEMRDLTDSIGRTVFYAEDMEKGPPCQGWTLGIGPDGGLVIKDKAIGSTVTLYSGEIRYQDYQRPGPPDKTL